MCVSLEGDTGTDRETDTYTKGGEGVAPPKLSMDQQREWFPEFREKGDREEAESG